MQARSSEDVSGGTASEASERVRLRYPTSRIPRPLMILAVAVLAGAALTGLIWAATSFARPAVAGQVAAYTVRSDREIAVTVTVDRRDPSVPVVCRVVAQAADFQVVGSVDRLPVGPRPERVVNVTVTIATLRRATSASVKGCTVS